MRANACARTCQTENGTYTIGGGEKEKDGELKRNEEASKWRGELSDGKLFVRGQSDTK
jgi:hypothetical protein